MITMITIILTYTLSE